MTLEEIYTKISNTLPKIIYITGKTCLGKTTFAKKLRTDFGYVIIELDEIVRQDVIQKNSLKSEPEGFVVYKNMHNTKLSNDFIQSARNYIEKNLEQNNKIIIEGAIANPEILYTILKKYTNFELIYFHPSNINTYVSYITKRFLTSDKDNGAGLPVNFWDLINQEDFDQFCKTKKVTQNIEQAIYKYAENSAKSSNSRLEQFKHKYPNLLEVNI